MTEAEYRELMSRIDNKCKDDYQRSIGLSGNRKDGYNLAINSIKSILKDIYEKSHHTVVNTLEFQEYLAKTYGYKNLEPAYSNKVRSIFRKNIPEFLSLNGSRDQQLWTRSSSLITTGYNRIVIGDYGAFIEFDAKQSNKAAYICKPGQEFRFNDPKYAKNVKYYWYTINDSSDVKIYYQVRPVSYADYKPDMYYVSVHEVMLMHVDLSNN